MWLPFCWPPFQSIESRGKRRSHCRGTCGPVCRKRMLIPSWCIVTGSTARSGANSAPNASAADEKASERAAVQDMSAGDHDAHSSHMTMTAMREQAPGDEQRANEIVAQLRSSLERYKDYHAALADGFQFFCRTCRSRNITSPAIATDFWRALRLMGRDQRRCCTRRLQLAQLVGAMYTMPKRATETN